MLPRLRARLRATHRRVQRAPLGAERRGGGRRAAAYPRGLDVTVRGFGQLLYAAVSSRGGGSMILLLRERPYAASIGLDVSAAASASTMFRAHAAARPLRLHDAVAGAQIACQLSRQKRASQGHGRTHECLNVKPNDA